MGIWELHREDRMADYKERLEEWQQAARRKARELDEKYSISDMVGEAAKRGAESVANGAERLRAEAERLTDDEEVSETARRAASHVKKAGEAVRNVAGDTGKKVFDDARTYYDRASQFYDTGARFTRASTAATAGALKARDWIKANPGKAAVVSVSLVLGIRAGAAFPGLDAVLLGSHPHWLTHSALPVWGLKKASEKFEAYLHQQEERIAAGAAMFAQIVQPGAITGAPISWLLGGNPFLDGVWLFANGVICFHQGYKFFMMALANQDEVIRVVREIKGLLPAAAGVN